MNLSRKILAIIAFLLAFQLLAFYLASRAFFFYNFARLEEQYASRNIERATSLMENQKQNLAALAEDWAAWDDTYNFIQKPTEEYIKSNLVDETFEGLGVNLILFLNHSGELVFGKAYDLELHRETPLPNGWKKHFSAGSPLLFHPSPKEGKVGVITLSSDFMLVAVHPIVTSLEEGPIMGTFVIGYYLDQTWAERISQVVRFPVSIFAPSELQTPRELVEGKTFALRFPDSRTMEAFALLNDLYGQPALVLKVTMPRELYRQSQILFFLFSLLNLLIGLVFGGSILIFLRWHLLSRLTRLSEGLRAIALSGNISARVAVEGKDELTELENRINALLTSLEESLKALEESEKWHRMLINSITDGLLVIDRNLKLRQVNETGARFLGARVEELLGKNLEDCLKEPIFSDFYQTLIRTFERNTIQTISIPCQTPEGEKIFEMRLYPLPDGALCIARDVTELRRAERFYVKAQKMETAGRMALAIAHDFNNLLAPILAGTELLLTGAISLQNNRALLEEIRKACEKASNLVKQLLLFGRKEPLTSEVINLNAIIREMESLVVRILGQKVELILDLAPELYPIEINKSHAEQILINLVMNAKDAMPSGGQLIVKTENVQLEEEALTHPEAYPGKFVRLLVKDTGVGISPEVMEHIFEPFFTTKEPGAGTGLGLSVVYSIVKQNRGWIEVKSAPGEGAAFYIYFPALEAGEK
ncbi:MAG: CHASE4 domain-containing protein [Anaerolineae bacterium]|nr:ATP-binding protein [Anaerolineae bacterium]MDW8102930.1 CHASE4 domain-containing protein [Anaerolineae bacterium]